MIVNCPDCHIPVMITKAGKIPRHGWKGYKSNIRGHDWIEIKPACTGSNKIYKKGKNNEFKFNND